VFDPRCPSWKIAARDRRDNAARPDIFPTSIFAEKTKKICPDGSGLVSTKLARSESHDASVQRGEGRPPCPE
jgi:hypothetical protein